MCVVTWLPSLGKYIPGKFAAVAGAIWMLRQYGVPAAIGASVVMIQQGLAVLTGLMLAFPLCFWQPVHDRFPMAWVWSIILSIAGIACLHPRILGGVVNFALRRLRREPLRQLPSLPRYTVPMLLLIASWMTTGAATWLTARAIIPVSPSLLPLFAGANALAMSLGTLAVVPAGIGVREGLLLVVLTPMTGPVASILVLVLRLQSTIIELLLAAVSLLLLRRLKTPETCDGCSQAAGG